MTKQRPATDTVAQQAAQVLDRCLIGPVTVPEHMRPFMEDLVAVLLKVGLPFYDPAESGGAATGVMLALVPGPAGAAVEAIWRQHHSTDVLSEVWRAQQDAMHTALRTILTAQDYWMSDDTGNAPIVYGPHRRPL